MFTWKCPNPTGTRPWKFTAFDRKGVMLAEFAVEEPTTQPRAKKYAEAYLRNRFMGRGYGQVTVLVEGL